MLNFLPQELKAALRRVNLNYVYEIRLRAEKPITVNYLGEYLYLTDFGIGKEREKALTVTQEEIADVVFAAGKYSVYSVEEQLRQGFITAEDGERIGLSGRYVFEKGQPITVRDFTSLCIRIPHEITGCAETLYARAFADGLCHLLIGGAPGQGKTTLLRDLCRIIGRKLHKNVLICDERGEIGVGDVGDFTDVFSFADKRTALELGVRSMRPDVIVTDELSMADLEAIRKATAAGVTVIASIHIGAIDQLDSAYRELFDKIAVLDREEIGKIKAIYHSNGRKLV